MCVRGDYKEDRVWHDFSDWNYKLPNSCEQARHCKRDNHAETRIAHSFSNWEYTSSKSCEQIRMCNRDNLEERRMEHNYIVIDTEPYSNCYKQIRGQLYQADGQITTYRCTRCDSTKTEAECPEGFS